MTAQEVLCQYVDKYMRLSTRYGESSKRVADAYCKLKDLLLVELYFMKAVRVIVHEEELSGFVLYVESRLRSIIDSYRPDQSPFMPYFEQIMEYRALSYIKQKRKRGLIALAYEHYYMHSAEEVAESSPEDAYMNSIERLESERKRKKLMDRLRYVCACRPCRRRNLFILLCSLMPHLSNDAIDDFCRELNCNRDQTFAIADYLRSELENKEKTRGSRFYSRDRLDYFWSRKMEMEYAFDHSDRRSVCLSDNIRRITSLISNLETDRRKMNVEYPVLGKLLNLEPSRIAYAVYSSRKLLDIVVNGNAGENSYIGMQARTTVGRKRVFLSRLDPFRDFGIKGLKAVRYDNAS